MKLFIILIIVLVINGTVYTELTDEDYYDLNDSKEHVLVVEFIIKKLTELSKATSEINTKFDTKIEDINIRIHDVEKKNDGMDKKLIDVLTKIQKHEQRLDSSSNTLAVLNGRFDDIKKKYDDISTELPNVKKDALTKLEDHEQRLNKSSKTLAVLDGRFHDVKNKYDGISTELTKVKNDALTKLQDHEQRLETSSKRFNDVNNKYDDISTELSNVKKDTLTKFQDHEQRLETSSKTLAELGGRFDDVKKKYDGISTELSNVKKDALTKLQDHEQRLETSSKTLAVLDERFNDLKKKHDGISTELSNIKKDALTKLEDHEQRLNTPSKTLAVLDGRFNDVKMKYDGISTELSNIKKDASTKHRVHEQRLETTSKTLAVLDGRINKLNSRLDVSTKEHSTFKDEIMKRVAEYKNAFQNDLKKNIADINQVLSTSANEVLTFKNEISKTLKDHNAALQKLENNLRQHKERQENQIKTLWENGSLEKKSDWIVILRRQDGSVNFNRNWLEYKNGFGNTNSEFFIGMEKLHNITSNGLPHEMVITLRTFDGNQTYAKYDNIVIGSEKDQYELKVLGVYSGDAGDSLKHLEGEKFTTIDRDNDQDGRHNCAEVYKGPWWYYQCNPDAQLFGPYEKHKSGMRVRWSSDHMHDLQYVEVKIKK
ncbi:uncharacterized protein isoform X4 [Musca autumnalis]|uniref:uncharacterized protein isoform X4 n=1 Tax=Musca autumnalis TaxID=221902 RepID=UPI003CFB9766